MIYRAELTPGTVFLRNNLSIFYETNMWNANLDQAFEERNNVITDADPGVVNINGFDAEDDDLPSGSTLVDQGMAISTHPLDYLNRPAPAGVSLDIGAFEHQL